MIGIEDKTVDHVSRNRVIYDRAPRTEDRLQRVVRSMIVEELALRPYPIGKQFKPRTLPPAEPLPDPKAFGLITRL